MATTISQGDAEAALAQAPRRIKGTVRGDGQKAFYMGTLRSAGDPRRGQHAHHLGHCSGAFVDSLLCRHLD